MGLKNIMLKFKNLSEQNSKSKLKNPINESYKGYNNAEEFLEYKKIITTTQK